VKKRALFWILLALLVFLWQAEASYSWGFYAHRRINAMAVYTLPPAMIGFYKKHIGYLTQHAVDPDRRRFANANEGPRHFFDSDHYGQHPFDSVPQLWTQAVLKYGEDSLVKHGIVCWHIQSVLGSLTKAFRLGDVDGILHYSSDLGHYVGDVHVPLHTTTNYNGQFSGQQGIHAFWESRIPELRGDRYNYFVGRADYLEKPGKQIWEAAKASYSAKDSVLLFESELNSRFPPDQKYSFESRGSVTQNLYSERYTLAYDSLLGGMVERRMRQSIHLLGSLWYTAWVNAGQPDLAALKAHGPVEHDPGEGPRPNADSTRSEEF
jgi:hypothetical protein